MTKNNINKMSVFLKYLIFLLRDDDLMPLSYCSFIRYFSIENKFVDYQSLILNLLTLQYSLFEDKRSTTSGCKNKRIRKLEFE